MDNPNQNKIIVDELLKFGTTLPKEGTFTGNSDADKLLRANPYAFFMAAANDRGSKAESVWMLPWRLKNKLGELNPESISILTSEQLEIILRQLPKKPRFPNQAARTIISLSKLIMEEFEGDAEKVLNLPLIEFLYFFQRIYGVGPGIAHMTIRILIDEDMYEPKPDEYRFIDVKPDVHVIRVFFRSGLIRSRDGQSCVVAARKLNPEFPAKLDWPAWEIGRKYCDETSPNCIECPLGNYCPKN